MYAVNRLPVVTLFTRLYTFEKCDMMVCTCTFREKIGTSDGIILTWMSISIIAFRSGVTCNDCTDRAAELRIPVVSFCTTIEGEGNPVMVDGFYANSLNIKNCICVANVIYPPQKSVNLTLTYENTDDISPIQNVNDCDSSVYFSQPFLQQRDKSCNIDGSMPIMNENNDIELHLVKKTLNGDTRYCFKLGININYRLKLSCIKTKVSGTQSKMTSIENTNPTTTPLESTKDLIYKATSTQHINTNNSTISATDGFQNDNTDKAVLLYIAIVCGVGGGLFLILAVIVICLIKISGSRKKKQSSRESNEHNDFNDDEYGLQYNILYVSTDDEAVQHK